MKKGGTKAFNASDYVRPGVSEDQVNEIKHSFDLFDTDGGGSIDFKGTRINILELKAAMVSLGFDSKNGVIFQMLSDLDEDGSGELEFNEWLHLMTSRVNNRDTKSNIDKIFNLYDDEKTGSISIKNLRRVAQDLG